MSLFAKSDPTPISAWPTFERAKEILELLSGFRNYPQTDRGRKLFVTAIMKARSPEHAEAALGIIEGAFPSLGQLRDAIRRTASEFKQQFNPNPACLKCNATGWQIVESVNVSAATRCDCWGDFEPVQLADTPGEWTDPNWWRRTLREALEARENREREERETLLRIGQESPPEAQG